MNTIGTIVQFQIQVPSNRTESVRWFVQQAPERVADILDCIIGIRQIEDSANDECSGNSVAEKELVALRSIAQEKEDRIVSLQGRIDAYRSERMSQEQEFERELTRRLEKHQGIHNQLMTSLQESSQRAQHLYEAQLQHAKDSVSKEYEKQITAQKDELSKLNAALLSALQEKSDLHQAYVTKLTPMIEANQNALHSIGARSTARTGIIGENLVYDVFAGLNMGYLQDQRHSKDMGCEDYLWTYQEKGLVCSIEVKFSERLHSQNDMQKHITRIQEASRSARANCALFLSLKCPIPNTREIDIKIISGIPVIYISGGSNKELTPHMVARLGFEMMNTTWSHLKTHTSEEINDVLADQVIQDIAKHFEKQLQTFVTIDKEVQNLTKHANSLLRSAEKLNKVRTEMVGDITSMQIRHPEIDGTSNDSVASREESAQAIELILKYNETHKRYPKSLRDLPSLDQHPDTIDFDAMILHAKQEYRKRKRANVSSNLTP